MLPSKNYIVHVLYLVFSTLLEKVEKIVRRGRLDIIRQVRNILYTVYLKHFDLYWL